MARRATGKNCPCSRGSADTRGHRQRRSRLHGNDLAGPQTLSPLPLADSYG
jgi:hypothetical protein